MYGRTFLILAAITFDKLLASTFSRDVGRQFSKSARSFPFFSIKVIIAYHCLHSFSIRPWASQIGILDETSLI